MEKVIYDIELTSSYAEWWRYNLYLSAVEFDSDGARIGYRNAVDRVYDIEDGAGRDIRRAPADWSGGAHGRSVKLTTDPCHHIAIYVYVIANTFPESAQIRDSPPFPAELIVRQVSGGEASRGDGSGGGASGENGLGGGASGENGSGGGASGDSGSGEDGREIFRQTYDVNQWGGLTIAGLRIGDAR